MGDAADFIKLCVGEEYRFLESFNIQGLRSYFESGGGGGLTSDSKWGGGLKTPFLSNSLKFPKTWGGGS